jgi:Raf kinase inhibitor-like YbhB/YbcL family protein
MMRFVGQLFGRRVRSWRAGDEWRVAEDIRFSQVPRTIVVQSAAFAYGEPIPPDPASPPLAWSGVPPEAKMLALVVEDVDVPLLRPLTHAVAYAIDPATTSLEGGALDGTHVTMGYNGAGRRGYVAPAPLPGHGIHRYVFTLLAVDFVPRFDQPPTRGRLLDAIAGHVAALGELIGSLER